MHIYCIHKIYIGIKNSSNMGYTKYMPMKDNDNNNNNNNKCNCNTIHTNKGNVGNISIIDSGRWFMASSLSFEHSREGIIYLNSVFMNKHLMTCITPYFKNTKRASPRPSLFDDPRHAPFSSPSFPQRPELRLPSARLRPQH